ncbi:Macro domain-containing protein [Brevibacillus sp. IT-7CA2]|uniref:macro domain-containing protein n=1 Tax=Brevibacillus sp. IT-7CA2 TaxID=3026436 RepID=UPI0039E1D6B0
MISIHIGDITHFEVDAIVNASNGQGFMGGLLGRLFHFHGVAESLHFATKGVVEKEARAICQVQKIEPGSVFVTSAYSLQARYVFHAVTMRKPGQKSTMETVKICLQNIVKEAQEFQVSSVAVPLLGTGTGRLDKQQVHELTCSELEKSPGINWIIVSK